MPTETASIPTFPLNKKQLLIVANVFFWVCFVAFDTISTAGMMNGFFLFTFQRAIVQALILFLLVYPNLYWLYPRYFSKGNYLKYSLVALALLAFNVYLRTSMDNFFLTLFLEGDFYNTPKGQEAYQTLLKSQFMTADNELVFSYYFGMTLGSIAVFFITTPIKLVEDWYEKQMLSLQVLENRLQLNDSKIKFLKAQTDPHFLINALSGVYNLALLQSDKIDFAILRLSELMGYLLGHGKEDEIALRYEINFIQNFIDFHQTINPTPINIDFQHNATATQLEQIRIPPMLLQPFFENALKHGNADEDPDGWIKSELKIEAETLSFTLKNSLKPSSAKRVSYNVGMQNLKERLEMYFPKDKHWLKTEKTESEYEVRLILVMNGLLDE